MSFDSKKTDPKLGKKVQDYLTKKGLHTPAKDNGLSKEEKIATVKKHFTGIMEALGLDLEDDSLMDTPNRVAKMYVNEVFWGLNPDNFPKATVIQNKMGCNEMVVEKGITVSSNCEHHFVIIDGKATVAYIPADKVLGLSKLNRVVEYFSRRQQVQERLTLQIAHALSCILETDDVAVVIDAVHYCVKSRGVEDVSSSTVTSYLGGRFKEGIVRQEFLSLARRCI